MLTTRDILAITAIAVLMSGSTAFIGKAYAVNCQNTYGQHCYAVDLYFPKFSVNGVRSTNQIKTTTVTGYLLSPT